MANKYPISVKELTDMMEVQLKPDEQANHINGHGGLEGLCKKLKVNPLQGLSSTSKQDLEDRAAQFGKNEIPAKPPKTFLGLMWEAVQDTTLIILIVCAVISLALSFYHDSESVLDEEYSQIGKLHSLN